MVEDMLLPDLDLPRNGRRAVGAELRHHGVCEERLLLRTAMDAAVSDGNRRQRT